MNGAAGAMQATSWALIEPLMPAPNRIGRPRKTDLREVVNALLYMASSGVRIPTLSGQAFQLEAGRRSDVKPATIPINIRPL
jgi:hypothetical protein